MSDSPIEEDDSSSEQDEVDDYADLDDFDDGAMFGSSSAAVFDQDEDGDTQMASETNLDMVIDVEGVKEKFNSLPTKPEVGVARVHGDIISLYLPFYSYLNKGLQLAWKEYENSHIVVDLKVDMTEYRRAKNLPLVTVVLSSGTTAPPAQLFCDHLRTISLNYIQENFKDRERNVLAGLFEELLGRIENLSNFCCFCDKRLGDEGAFFPIFCSSSLCSFQGEEFLRAHPKARGSARVFYNVLKLSEYFKSMKYAHQALILHESPDQVADFEKRRQLKPVRFLYYNNKKDDWMDFVQRADGNLRIPLTKKGYPRYSNDSESFVLCEVVDDPSTLIQLTRHDYLVRDVRSMRFRVGIQRCENVSVLSEEDELRLMNQLFFLQGRGTEHLSPVEGERFNLAGLPDDLLLSIFQLISRREVYRFKLVSKKFHNFVRSISSQLPRFQNVAMRITREKQEVQIRLANVIDRRIVTVLVELPKPVDLPNVAQDEADITDEFEDEPENYDEPEDVDIEVNMEEEEPKPVLFNNFTIKGADKDEWKAIVFHVKDRTLKEVVASLVQLMEIASLEIHRVSRFELIGLLQVLPDLQVLEAKNVDYEDRTVAPERLFDVLPSTLVSLNIGSEFVGLLTSFVANSKIQNLQQLHVYGYGNPMLDEEFQAIQVRRLYLEECEVTLVALRAVVAEWRAGVREIDAMMVKVGETVWHDPTLALPFLHGRQPGQQQGQPQGQAVPQQRPVLTQAQIFEALKVDPATSRIQRIFPGIELEAKVVNKKEHDEERVFVHLLAHNP